MKMDQLEKYIKMFNETSYPIRFPYFLEKWGPYDTPDNKHTIGLELKLFIDTNKFKTLFIVYKNFDKKEDQANAEKEVIEAFKMIDFNQYLKYLWKES